MYIIFRICPLIKLILIIIDVFCDMYTFKTSSLLKTELIRACTSRIRAYLFTCIVHEGFCVFTVVGQRYFAENPNRTIYHGTYNRSSER